MRATSGDLARGSHANPLPTTAFVITWKGARIRAPFLIGADIMKLSLTPLPNPPPQGGRGLARTPSPLEGATRPTALRSAPDGFDRKAIERVAGGVGGDFWMDACWR